MTEKIYLHNPYLKELNTKIVKKEYSNNKFYLTLNRTIFFPNMSGGQPKDIGTINGIEVEDVYEEKDEIIHIVRNDIKQKNVKLAIDWNHRFDCMQQHTGQHILSTAFNKLLNANTIGFHLGQEYVYIDVAIRSLNSEFINKIEKFANKIIFSNFEIKKYYIDKNEVSKLPLSKSPSVNSNIRIVEIDNIDYNPCCGTHTRSTGEVGLIKIRKFENYKGNTRIEFVCGNRALKDFSWKNSQINQISNLLSIKDTQCLNSVRKIYDDNKKYQKTIKKQKEELLRYKSKELIDESIIYKDKKIIIKLFSYNNFNEIRNIATNLIENNDIIVVFGLLNNEKCQLIMACSDNININMKEVFDSVIHIIDGNGGGSTKIVQGGGNKIDSLEECLECGLEIIKNKL